MEAPRVHVIILCLLWAAPACTVGDVTGGESGPGGGGDPGSGGGPGGGGGGADGPDGSVGRSISLSVTPDAVPANLGSVITLQADVTSDGYSGPLSLALDGVPSSWSVQVDAGDGSSVLTFAGSGTLTATVRVSVPTNADAGDLSASLVASGDLGQQASPVSFQVANVYRIPISDRTGAGNHGFPSGVALQKGATVQFANFDTQSAHLIHADGGSAFPHEDGEMAQAPSGGQVGGTYEITTTQSGIFTFYCHDHGDGSGVGSVNVAP